MNEDIFARSGDGDQRLRYTGQFWPLFWLATVNAFATLITLGIWRFWMVTRLRRFYWSSIRIDGQPMEYTGTGVEKLIGFLIALVLLAVVLAGLNLALVFVGLSYFDGNPAALNATFLVIIPLGFWAQYRARRYITSRTRWRGIRFGMEPAAWAYTFRVLGWWLVLAFSFGLLYPLMQMDLARFTTGRTFFGDLRFHQGGGWWPLMMSWLFVWVPAAAAIAYLAYTIFRAPEDFEIDLDSPEAAMEVAAANASGLWILFLLVLWIWFWSLRHRIFTFRYLTSHKTIGGGTSFTATISVWRIIWVYIFGGICIGLFFTLLSAIIAVIAAIFIYALVGSLDTDVVLGAVAPELAQYGAVAGTAVGYLISFALLITLNHVFITQPVLHATIRSMTVHNLAAATRARQREHDDATEAGGFADALGADVGGAF